MNIEDALFCNRDENSFTARLFEGSVFPQCYKEPEIFFPAFIRKINKGMQRCETYCEKENLSPVEIPETLKFKDGMLFAECVDLFAAANKMDKGVLANYKKAVAGFQEDKTEFDTIIVAEDNNNETVLLVFEVKCYSNLEHTELKRQQNNLNVLQHVFGFDYYHIALIAEDYLKHAKKIFQQIADDKLKNFSIISWKDLLGDDTETNYLKNQRFKGQSLKLSKTISKEVRSNPRSLI
jgi:hypothetical protein